jgi:hypothetical protein
VTRCRVQVQLAGRTSIAKAFRRFYEGESDFEDTSSPDEMKFVDAQGHTVNKSRDQIEAEHWAKKGGRPSLEMPRASAPPPAASVPPGLTPKAAANGDPAETLKAIEETQKKEVIALRSMVELLIQKGIFTREEYLAKVKPR